MKIKNSAQVLIVCGSGHNGGDGLAAARLLKKEGLRVKVLFLKPAQNLKGISQTYFEKIKKLSIPYLERPEPNMVEAEAAGSGLMVDALLGTGFKGQTDGLFGETIEKMNRSKKPVIAVDIPSGLDADAGKNLGACVRARLTVTMGALKKGFLAPQAKKWTGKVVVADIGFPKELFSSFNHIG